MQYLGGKARIARRISTEILSRKGDCDTYLEPFVGGGSVFSLVAPSFETAYAGDVVPDLVQLWREVAAGWIPPATLTREEYELLRNSPPSALRAFAGFGMSFGGKWFAGYATNARGRDYCGVARRGLARKGHAFRDREISLCEYTEWSPGPGTLVYCDPPYAGTTEYGAARGFDSELFWRTMGEWSESGAVVLVSEHVAPAGWVPVWEHVSTASLKASGSTGDRHERLFASDSYLRKIGVTL